MRNKIIFNLSPGTKISNIFPSYMHKLRIFMDSSNHPSQFLHSWFFLFHNSNHRNRIYKAFEEVENASK